MDSKQTVNTFVKRNVDFKLNAVFNLSMNTPEHIIDRLGGPAKVAELMGLSGKPGQIQRISNWKRRGIPARVLLDFPHVFGDRVSEADPDSSFQT
ncbi:MAG: hypothetical protein ABN482_10485 [Corticimicrobacter sp.]|uniref:hypothetical protein n=1 Tax=Corticimicrobacter sp. TaxID=2678536 RepID=UPI0032DB5FEE